MVVMSACGTEETSQACRPMSVNWGAADSNAVGALGLFMTRSGPWSPPAWTSKSKRRGRQLRRPRWRFRIVIILLWNECLARRPDPGDLQNHLSILRPSVVRTLRGLGIKRAGGIRLELAFIPFLAIGEVERAG